MARPSKYTAELAKRICERIERGDYIETAAAAEGIHRTTLYEWCKSKPGFSDSITQARARAESDIIAELRDPPLDNLGRADGARVRALTWLLERTRRDRFGQVIELRAKQEATDAVLARLRDGLDDVTWERVRRVLRGESGSKRGAGTG